MAFTTSDNFTYVNVRLYDFYPGELSAYARNTNGDLFIIFLDEANTQHLKLVRKHTPIGRYLKRYGHLLMDSLMLMVLR